VERGAQLGFERDPRRGWMMVDPVNVRAEGSFIDQLVSIAVTRRGTPVDEAEIDLKKLGLDPPRFILELITDTGARHRIDVGATDLDRNRVNVLARGRVLRAIRDFETLLDIMPEEYQSHSATAMDPREVVEVRRKGLVLEPDTEKPFDIALDARLEDGEWRSTAPVRGRLDPLAMSLIVQNTAGLRFDHLVDTAGAPLAELGLDPPDMRFELVSARGERVELLFGRKPNPQATFWNGTRVGDPSVWSVPGDQALALAVPIEDLLDRRLHRFQRGEIDGLQLSTAEREVRLERRANGWIVAEARAGSSVFGPPLAADPRKVSDLLGALENTTFRVFLVGATLDEGEAREAIHVRAGGMSMGGAFGRAHETGGVRFQREDETVAAVVEESFQELVRTTPQMLWSNSILDVTEVEAKGLVLRRGDDEIEWQRDRYGVWVRKGRTNEAKELHAVLDPLLFLRASDHLESRSGELGDPIEVRWQLDPGGQKLERKLVVGLLEIDGVPQVVCDFEGRRSVLQRQDLHEKLRALF
jgi:hypothetical protein